MSDDSAPLWTLLLGCGSYTISAEAAQAVLDALRGPRRQRLVIVELNRRPSWVAIAHVAALWPLTGRPEPETQPVISQSAHRARHLT